MTARRTLRANASFTAVSAIVLIIAAALIVEVFAFLQFRASRARPETTPA